jgi:hypothetical protein
VLRSKHLVANADVAGLAAAGAAVLFALCFFCRVFAIAFFAQRCFVATTDLAFGGLTAQGVNHLAFFQAGAIAGVATISRQAEVVVQACCFALGVVLNAVDRITFHLAGTGHTGEGRAGTDQFFAILFFQAVVEAINACIAQTLLADLLSTLRTRVTGTIATGQCSTAVVVAVGVFGIALGKIALLDAEGLGLFGVGEAHTKQMLFATFVDVHAAVFVFVENRLALNLADATGSSPIRINKRSAGLSTTGWVTPFTTLFLGLTGIAIDKTDRVGQAAQPHTARPLFAGRFAQVAFGGAVFTYIQLLDPVDRKSVV